MFRAITPLERKVMDAIQVIEASAMILASVTITTVFMTVMLPAVAALTVAQNLLERASSRG